MIRLEHAALTHVGLVREGNEDAHLVTVDAAGGLFAVADGMGGHAAGEEASRIACRVLGKNRDRVLGQPPGGYRVPAVGEVFRAADLAVRAAGEAPERRGMGTTLTALFVWPDGQAVVGHAGDSRCYRLRADRCSQVTTDHKAGAHSISNGLGGRAGFFQGADIHCLEISPGDVFVLCSDGLSDYAGEIRVRAILFEMQGEEENITGRLAKRLVDYALSAGGQDNVTVVVARVL